MEDHAERAGRAGDLDGEALGLSEGLSLGEKLGLALGETLGLVDGLCDGLPLGLVLGDRDGERLGLVAAGSAWQGEDDGLSDAPLCWMVQLYYENDAVRVESKPCPVCEE